MKRSVLTGAGVGLALGMPLFEVALLILLAIDVQWFDEAYTLRYFTESANIFAILGVLHAVTAFAGACAGAAVHLSRSRRRLRVIPGRGGRA